ncbi:MAG: cobyric acid synthase, partial [Planctomycetaceae bacterium]|nr:cobyric acid synthase [Planctomycetaceae bacterium]
LVGDIERGGVFAQLLGTLWLLNEEERSLVRGLLVNKFRGDVSLFDEGRTLLEQRGGVPVLGVIPWLLGLDLPEEDAEVLSRVPVLSSKPGDLDIAVIRLPRISNFDDFAPLAAEAGVSVRYVDLASRLGRPHVVILPGTKSTMSDLEWLRQSGLAARIEELAGQGTHVVGICGGYQMLGQSLRDPEQIESSVAEMPGLGLLPTDTVFTPHKETHQVRGVIHADGHCHGARGQAVEGYEIHIGRTSGGEPWLELTRRDDGQFVLKDGAVSNNGRVWGCYLHGLFANDGFRRAWLNSLTRHFELEAVPRTQCDSTDRKHSLSDRLDASLNRLADGVEAVLDWPRLEQIVSNTEGIVR